MFFSRINPFRKNRRGGRRNKPAPRSQRSGCALCVERLENRNLLSIGPVISEFAASTSGTYGLKDGTSPTPQTPDWIELYNPTANAINLGTWSVREGDTEGAASDYPLPAVTLNARSYLVVFASGRGTEGQDAAGYWHLGFKLPAGNNGAYLALKGPNNVYTTEIMQYGPQDQDVSYGLVQKVTPFVAEAAAGKYRVATNSDGDWTSMGYNDASWATGTSAVGFDTSNTLRASIRTDVGSVMRNVNSSLRLRVPFTVSQDTLDSLDGLSLRIKYNNAFVAYLNGTEIARRNFSGTPQWNSTATEPASLTACKAMEDIDVAAYLSLLQAGDNVLAIQGMDGNASTDTSFLLSPQLVGTTTPLVEPQWQKFGTPTPRGANLPPTTFNVEDGFHSQSFAVSISNNAASTANNVADPLILYTTDGSDPGGSDPGPSDPSGSNPTGTRAAGRRSVTAITHVGTTYTATSDDHGFNVNDIVRIAGASPSAYNGDFRVSSKTTNSFTYQMATSLGTLDSGRPITAELATSVVRLTGITYLGTTATATCASVHGYTTGDGVRISGAGAQQAQYNGYFTVSTVDKTVASIAVTASTATGFTATVATTAAHGLAVNNWVRIGGALQSQYNGTVQIASVPSSATFTYNVTANTLPVSPATGYFTCADAMKFTYTMSSAPTANATPSPTLMAEQASFSRPVSITRSGTTATGALTDHGFVNGDTVRIAGADQTPYNGDFLISTISKTVNSTSGITFANGVATVTTTSAHGLNAGDRVRIAGADQPDYNGTFVIGNVTTTTFTYAVSGTPATPATGPITCIHADQFQYTMSSTPSGSATGTMVTAQLTSAHIYTGPITISGTTVLRAAVYTKNNVAISRAESHTYIFPDQVPGQSSQPAGLPGKWGITNPSVAPAGEVRADVDYEMDTNVASHENLVAALQAVPTLSIVANPVDLFGWPKGIYSNARQHGDEWERPASVQLIGTDGKSLFQASAGIRIHGGGCRNQAYTEKQSFSLYFDAKYGMQQLVYPLFGNGAADGFDRLVLRGESSDAWAANKPATERQTVLQDRFMADTYNAMGNLAPHGTWVQLYINGIYWGMYNPVEQPKGDFESSYLAGETYEENKNSYEVRSHDGPETDSTTLWDGGSGLGGLIGALNALNADPTNQSLYDAVDDKLDIAGFIDYAILNQFGGNWDWPNNNYYCSASADTSDPNYGKWRFHAWDGEAGLGGYKDKDGALIPVDEHPTQEHPEYKETDRVGIDFSSDPNQAKFDPWRVYAVMKNVPEFKLLFADRVHALFDNDGLLSEDNNKVRMDVLQAKIDSAIVGESARWGDGSAGAIPARAPAFTYTHATWLDQLDDMDTRWFADRAAVVMQDWQGAGLYPSVAPPSFNIEGVAQYGGWVAENSALTFASGGGTVYYTVDGRDPRLPFGGISSAARTASTYTISATTAVKARVLSGGTWSPLSEAVFWVDGQPIVQGLSVTIGALDDLANSGFVELMNAGDQTIDLSRMNFDEGIYFNFALGKVTSLAPGQSVVVAQDAQAYARRNPGAPVAGQYQGHLLGGYQTIRLTDWGGQVLCDNSQDYYWDADGDGVLGGYGVWDDTGYRWHVGSPDGPLAPWSDGNNAIISGDVGNVTINPDYVPSPHQVRVDGLQCGLDLNHQVVSLESLWVTDAAIVNGTIAATSAFVVTGSWFTTINASLIGSAGLYVGEQANLDLLASNSYLGGTFVDTGAKLHVCDATAVPPGDLLGINVAQVVFEPDIILAAPAMASAQVAIGFGANSTKADGSYKAGEVIPIQIKFSAPVWVSGTPLLEMATGTTHRMAEYASGSGTDTLVFNYTVEAGDESADLDYASMTALDLNGGSIVDGLGRLLTVSLIDPALGRSLAASRAIVIDTAPSTVASIGRRVGALTGRTSVEYVVTFDEAVTGVDTSDFALTASGTATGTIASVSGSGTTYVVTVNSVSGDGSLRLDLVDDDSIEDAAGNPVGGEGTTGENDGSFSTGLSYTITSGAITIPQVVSINRAGSSSLTNADSLNFTVTFSQSVTGVGPDDFALALAGTSGTIDSVSGSGTTWTVTVTDIEGDGTLGLDLVDDDDIVNSNSDPLGGTGTDATDGDGSFSAGQFYTLDNTLPSVTISAPSALATSGAPVTYTVTYSDANFSTATLSANNITLYRGLALATGTVTVSGSGASWSVTVSDVPGEGFVWFRISAGTATDLAGNSAAIKNSLPFALDTTPPGVTSITRLGASLLAAASVQFRVTFTENVTGVDVSDFALATTGTAAGTISSVSGSGGIYTVTVDDVSGNGTLGLNLEDDDTIIDQASQALGGTGAGNGDTAGQAYTLDNRLYWDADGDDSSATGGDGFVWEDLARWRVGSPTGPLQRWVDGVDAYFGGEAGEVTLLETIRPHLLKFLTSGYRLTSEGGGAIELPDDVTVEAPGAVATIDAYVFGDGGLNVASGAVVLGGENSATGDTVVAADAVVSLRGTLLGDIVNDGVLWLPNSTELAYEGGVTGSGDVETYGIAGELPNDDDPLPSDDSYDAEENTALVVSAAQGVLANDQWVMGDGWSFDLQDGFMVFAKAEGDTGELEALVRAMIIQGLGDGTWNGTAGVFSTVAASNWETFAGAIGFADASDLGLDPGDTYQGATIPTYGAVIVRYCYAGDADLNGLVDDGLDLQSYAYGYLFYPDAGKWAMGDFNYDGVVDDADDLQWYSYGYLFQGDPLTSPAPQYPLASYLLADAEHGTVELAADGSFTYTPDADYTGLDVFTYVVVDKFSGLPRLGTVTITVE
jgi:hypothetical protein